MSIANQHPIVNNDFQVTKIEFRSTLFSFSRWIWADNAIFLTIFPARESFLYLSDMLRDSATEMAEHPWSESCPLRPPVGSGPHYLTRPHN